MSEQANEMVKVGRGDDLDVAAGRCCPTCRHDLTPHNVAVWNAGYSVAMRHFTESAAQQATALDPLPADAPWPREECFNRGPRIGEDGTRCRRSKGHDGPHRTAPSDGFGHVEWRDL